MNEPTDLRERFLKAQAEYRSQAIHTTGEWPMDTPEGRAIYRQSMEREECLARLNGAQDVLARAEERLSVVPYGAVIDFDSLIYGQEVQ